VTDRPWVDVGGGANSLFGVNRDLLEAGISEHGWRSRKVRGREGLPRANPEAVTEPALRKRSFGGSYCRRYFYSLMWTNAALTAKKVRKGQASIPACGPAD